MFISDAIEYLNKTYSLSLNSSYYSHIKEWEDWWKGFHQPFHVYTEAGITGAPVQRELYKLRMAKKVCQDWATLLLNERTAISCSDPAAEAFLLGIDGSQKTNICSSPVDTEAKSSPDTPPSTADSAPAGPVEPAGPAVGNGAGKPRPLRFSTGILAESDLLRRLNHLLERAFATGTGAVLVRLRGRTDDAGQLSHENASLSFDFVDAGHIIPITVREGRVVEAAFCSEVMQGGKKALYLETHLLRDGRYHIRNAFFQYEEGALTPMPLPKGIAPEIITPCDVPMFAFVSPNISNDIDPLCGLGVSVFADAIDCLKGVDLAFNNFCRDLKLGGKKVFVSRSLLRHDGGSVFTPDDIAQQLFQTVGDTDFCDKPLISEHNPDLRTEENAAAVQHQLDYLSFKCGFGTRYFTFAGAGARSVTMTATQYMGERQDLIRSVARHSRNVEAMLTDILRAVLVCGHYLMGLDLDPRCRIRVFLSDSFITDDESTREAAREDVSRGLMTAEEYRERYVLL